MSLNRSLSRMYQKKTAALDESRSPKGQSSKVTPPSTHGSIDDEQASKKRKLDKEVKRKAKAEETIARCISSTASSLTLDDVGGLGKNKPVILEFLHFYRRGIDSTPEEMRRLGGRRVIFPNLLLEGPKGTGKSMLADAIANGLSIPCLKVDLRSTRFVSNVTSESVSNLKIVFEAALARQPCVLFLDNIDSVLAKKENAPNVNELMLELEEQIADLTDGPLRCNCKIVLICSTSKPATIDSDAKDNFESIQFSIPGHHDRSEILSILVRRTELNFSGDVSLDKLSEITPAYVGSDLDKLFVRAKRNAMMRSEGSSVECIEITMEDFDKAVKQIVPKLKTSGFPEVPKVTWDDVGGHDKVKAMLKKRIIQEIKCHQLTGDPIDYAAILMYGPPGCGKTHLAKALANEGNLNFLYVKGSELFNKYLGGTEKNIKSLFATAKECAPCLIFFDEVDAICPPRSSETDTGAKVNAVSALLNEMDGLVSRNCFMLGATNRKQAMDEAILRSGRFGHELFVGPPDMNDRLRILQAILRQCPRPCGHDVNFQDIAECTEGFTGADLKELIVEAKREAFAEALEKNLGEIDKVTIDHRHFEASYKIISDKLVNNRSPVKNKKRV